MGKKKQQKNNTLGSYANMGSCGKELNPRSQRKMPLTLSCSDKYKNIRLRKGKGGVFSLAESDCLLRKAVTACFFHGESCQSCSNQNVSTFQSFRGNAHQALAGCSLSSDQKCGWLSVSPEPESAVLELLQSPKVPSWTYSF